MKATASKSKEFGQRQEAPKRTPVAVIPRNPRERKSIPDLLALADNRRKYRRIKVRLAGRFMRENKNEYPCYTNDISAGGISLSAAVRCEPGERVILYLEEVGRLEATVIRNHDGGFAVALELSDHKREKLVGTLTWLLNQHEMSSADARRFERFVPDNSQSHITLPNGTLVAAEVLDLSLGGARIAVNIPLEKGDEIILGKSRGRVVRVDEDGVAVQFETPHHPGEMGAFFKKITH